VVWPPNSPGRDEKDVRHVVDCEFKGPLRVDCVYIDAMLGWLARMLRTLFGLPAVYKAELEDSELVATECLVVTRDRELFRHRKGPTILLTTDDHVKWIAVFLWLGLKPFEKSVCPVCGGPLIEVPCVEAEKAVGHRLLSHMCWRCASCGRYYWMGSHWRGLRKLVEDARKTAIRCQGIDSVA